MGTLDGMIGPEKAPKIIADHAAALSKKSFFGENLVRNQALHAWQLLYFPPVLRRALGDILWAGPSKTPLPCPNLCSCGLGRSGATRQSTISFGSVGRLRASSSVGLGLSAPRSPCANLILRAPGKASTSCKIGNFEMEGSSSPSSSAGCSKMPVRCSAASPASASKQKPRRLLPSPVCTSSRIVSAANPHSSVADLTGRGCRLWPCSASPKRTARALDHVAHGGPPRKPWTQPWLMPWSQNAWACWSLRSPYLVSITKSSETTWSRKPSAALHSWSRCHW